MVARRKPRVPGQGGTFGPGHRKVGGRKRGVPNRATRTLKEAVLMAAEQMGEDGRGLRGLLGYLRRIAREEPRTFVMLLVRAIPMEIAGDAARPVVVTLDERIIPHLAAGEQELLRAVLRAIAAGGAAVTVVGGPQKLLADPSRYAATLRSDTPTSGRA